jgi:2-methylcitrate dehydratase PrpD
MTHSQQISIEETGVTRQLSKFIVDSKFDALPSDVVKEASRAIVNCLGCAIGAAQHDTVNFAMAALTPFFGSPQAQIWGRSERADILHAALINGISSHVLDFDDTHFRAVHPSAPVLPAIFALAEWRQFSGKELVHAYVLGVEAEIRIALSVFPVLPTTLSSEFTLNTFLKPIWLLSFHLNDKFANIPAIVWLM